MSLMQLAGPTRATGLVVSVSPDTAGTVVTLCGEADIFTLPLVVDALTRAIADSDGAIIVDLGSTEFIDSSNVRALAGAWEALDDGGRTLTLRSPTRAVARVLVLLGLSALIEPRASVA